MRRRVSGLLAGAVGLLSLLLAVGLLGRLVLPRPLVELGAEPAERLSLQDLATGERAEFTDPLLVERVVEELNRAPFVGLGETAMPESCRLQVTVSNGQTKKELCLESSERVWREGRAYRCANEALDLHYLERLMREYGFVSLPGVEAEAVEKLVLENGRGGTRAEITDPEAIRYVAENLDSVEWERREYLPEISGYGYALTFYGGEGETLCRLSIDGPLLARQGGFRLQSRRGKCDVSYLEGLSQLYGK